MEKVKRKYKAFKEKYLLSEKTHYLLNSVTLQIQDSEIAKEYELARGCRFDSLYKYMTVVAVLFLVYRVYQVLVL